MDLNNKVTGKDATKPCALGLLGQDLSHHTVIFDLMTLTLKFDLLFKNFNLGHNL